MSEVSSPVWRFMRSRSGRGFLLHLSICAALSVAVGYGFYHFSLNWFKEHKSSEKIIALQLVDAFVTNYSAVRAQFRTGAPVGRPGREIVTPPKDAQMARTIEAFAAAPNPKPVSELLDVN